MIKIMLLVIILCVASYALGRSHTKIEVITEQIEVIKYVEKEKAKIHSRPNANRSALLALMYADKM